MSTYGDERGERGEARLFLSTLNPLTDVLSLYLPSISEPHFRVKKCCILSVFEKEKQQMCELLINGGHFMWLFSTIVLFVWDSWLLKFSTLLYLTGLTGPKVTTWEWDIAPYMLRRKVSCLFKCYANGEECNTCTPSSVETLCGNCRKRHVSLSPKIKCVPFVTHHSKRWE